MNKSIKSFCEKKGNYRIAFKTKAQADLFIESQSEMMGENTGLAPVRSFYCPSCNMWHVTHFPLTPEMHRKEERDRQVQRLQLLVEELKNAFRLTEWQLWKPIIAEGLELLQYFRDMKGYEKLVESTSGILEQRSASITTCEAKETDAANIALGKGKLAIEHAVNTLDFENFRQAVQEMTERLGSPVLQRALTPSNLRFLNAMMRIAQDDDLMTTLSHVMEEVARPIPNPVEVPLEDLYERVLSLTLWTDRLLVGGLPKEVWKNLKKKVNKISNVLENNIDKGETVMGLHPMDSVRYIANERMLDAAAACADGGDKAVALEFLEYADARICHLPLSRKKIELMKRVCEIGEKLF